MATKCPHCGSERVELRASVGGTGKRFRCDSCLKAWTTGTGSRSGRAGGARGARNPGFPSVAVLTPEEAQERFEMLLSAHARSGAAATDVERKWRDEMSAALSRDAIGSAGLEVFKEIATSKSVATTGPQTAFYKELIKLGDEEGGRKARETAQFLLYGDDGSLAERLTALIDGGERGMPGFREALLTKILAISEPTKFLPILTAKGKAAFVQHIWGVKIEADKKQSSGDAIVATNDALVERLAPTFPDLLDAAAFLWWSQTHP